MGTHPAGSFGSFGTFGSSFSSCSSTTFSSFNPAFGSSSTSWGVGSDCLHKSSVRNSTQKSFGDSYLSESKKCNKKLKTNVNFGNTTNNNESVGTYWENVLNKNLKTKETSAKTEDKRKSRDSDR